MKKPVVIIAFRHTPLVEAKLSEQFEVFQNEEGLMPVAEVIALAQKVKASGLLVSVSHLFSAEAIASLPESVKVIATSSVGFEHLAEDAAKKRGIVLTNTPDVLSDCTADLAMTLLLNVARRTREYLRIMEEGWPRFLGHREMLGVNLRGKTLGIFGMGSIGQALAVRARAFGMNIIYCNRNRLPSAKEQGAVYYSRFLDMLPECDFLSLNAPATEETINILNDSAFARLKKGAILINVARGSLVDEEALMRALRAKTLRGAGLDVFQKEPAMDQRLLEFPEIFLTPHMGSATVETRDAMGLLAMNNIIEVLAGRPAITPV